MDLQNRRPMRGDEAGLLPLVEAAGEKALIALPSWAEGVWPCDAVVLTDTARVLRELEVMGSGTSEMHVDLDTTPLPSDHGAPCLMVWEGHIDGDADGESECSWTGSLRPLTEPEWEAFRSGTLDRDWAAPPSFAEVTQ